MAHDMKGKTVLLTGGTSGIGERSAAALARLGARVFITGRDPGRAAAAAAKLRAETGGEALGLGLDLESLADVRRFAAEFTAAHPKLDVLINNAGAGYQTRRVTPEGHEASLAVNHLGPFLLTHLLLGALEAAAPSRVIYLSSRLHRMVKLDWDDVESERAYKGFPDAYGRAKLAGTICVYALARRFEGRRVVFHVADPGVAATNYAETWTGLTRFFFYTMMRPFLSAPEKAARSTVALASDPRFGERTGLYVTPPAKEVRSSAGSYEREAGERMYALSRRLVGLAPE